MLKFEEYLNDFDSTISISGFILNLVIVTILALCVKEFYIRFGNAISDRRKFSNNFIPLALGTMLIITVIKSSIALSLGLVGALSIVRFRAAIKDPEELTFLFLIIGLGLIGGANKPILAVFSFALILPILYFNSRISKTTHLSRGNSYLNLSVANSSVSDISKLIEPHTKYLELNRFDSDDSGDLQISYFCQIETPEKIDNIKSALNNVDSNAKISFVDKPNLLL